MALPMISARLEGAAPHIKDPDSKMAIATRNVPLTWGLLEMSSTFVYQERMKDHTLNIL
jgi:hypothetical protein